MSGSSSAYVDERIYVLGRLMEASDELAFHGPESQTVNALRRIELALLLIVSGHAAKRECAVCGASVTGPARVCQACADRLRQAASLRR